VWQSKASGVFKESHTAAQARIGWVAFPLSSISTAKTDDFPSRDGSSGHRNRGAGLFGGRNENTPFTPGFHSNALSPQWRKVRRAENPRDYRRQPGALQPERLDFA
jgi:hypothetical protein